MKPIIIFGAKGIGKTVLDILQKNELFVYGFLDDDQTLQETRINDVPVLGTMQEKKFLHLLDTKCAAFVAIEKIEQRKTITEQLAKNPTIKIINAIHPNTTLSEEITLGHGNLINVRTSLGANVCIGNGCTIEGHTMLAHDVKIGDFVHIGAGSIIHAGVTVPSNTYIGTGSILLPNIKIKQGAYIKPGALVEKDIT